MTGGDGRSYPARPILAASVAVFRDGKVLLAERVTPPGASRFSLPGGLVETGETLEEAALRELLEETGVEAEIIGFNDHLEVIERDNEGRVERHFVVATFVGRWIAGAGTVGPEARRIAWVDPADVDHLLTTTNLPRILAGAARLFNRA